ncbi:hypothetical protein BTM25_52890 [Actinomadura rubteroloni]|uniref:DUF6493 domain-containing protein n=1 Tax=Actinomadura rubteroloni TaxID=1926885 RepID=A0A2P4UDE9_9ACTN|nr:DUF6493 family protein [Actinomadura rubteroloni]POM23083.1 hypothetical protein BTM25_52890 [Actinomadura rubteroloni]
MNVRDLVDAGDAAGVVRLVATMPEDERRATARALPALLRELKAGGWHPWGKDGERADALALAGAGCIAGAAAAATWLCKGDVADVGQRPRAYPALISAATAHRTAAWRADVAARMTGRLRFRDDPMMSVARWRAAAALTLAAGTAPPAGDAFVVGWATCTTALADDPFLSALLPRLFEADGVGAALQWDVGETAQVWTGVTRVERPSWLAALTALADAGRVDRDLLLDGCLGRFLRGGRSVDLQWFVRLYDALAPGPDETAARLRDHLRLLPSAPVPVAERALAAVRTADEAGGLDAAAFAEAAGALLFRPEKKLVKATLGWMDRTARRHGRVDATLRALPVLFSAEAADLRDRAVACAVKHAAHAGADVRAEIRDAAAELPAASRATIAEAFGAVAAPVALAFPDLPAYAPRPFPAPAGSAAELAERLAAARPDTAAWQDVERLVADVVAFAWRDGAALRAALDGVVPRHPDTRLAADFGTATTWLGLATGAVLDGRTRPRPKEAHARFRRDRPHGTGANRWLPPILQRFLAWRMREAADAVGRIPLLLATPTDASGALDPDVLLRRCAELDAAGVRPGRADAVQAVLRLPREAADVAERLVPGARAWFDAPAVACAVEPVRVGRGDRDYAPRLAGRVTLKEKVPAELDRAVRLPSGRSFGDAFATGYTISVDRWPGMLPHHREVAAAHLLPSLPLGMAVDWFPAGVTAGLAAAGGPAGPATAAVLACGLSGTPAARAEAVDALLVLAARDALAAADLGTAVAALAGQGIVKVNRVAESLGQAADAGAHRAVFAAVTAGLPVLLPAPGARAAAGLPDLLALAARIAETARLRADVPEVAAVAARGGSSRLVREAARLHQAANG